MRRLAKALLIAAVLLAAAMWWLSGPQTLPGSAVAGIAGDPGRGAAVFAAAGCAACHMAPKAEMSDSPILSGGRRFPSPFGTFVAPNISSDPDVGIGGWSVGDLADAMINGVSPDGAHYYPAFPYTSYARVELQDIADLHAFLMTLPGSDRPSAPHEVGFPFNLRRGLGLWKRLFADNSWAMEPVADPQIERGRYLVEALGHCSECHTARNVLGATDRSAWLAGAPNPEGKGKIPDIRPRTLGWSAQDLVYYFETGLTPDFDSAGGRMTDVIANLSRLTPEDREAIAAYLLALPDAQPPASN